MSVASVSGRELVRSQLELSATNINNNNNSGAGVSCQDLTSRNKSGDWLGSSLAGIGATKNSYGDDEKDPRDSIPPVNNNISLSFISDKRNRMGEVTDKIDFVSKDTHWGCFGVGEKVFAFWKGRTSYSTGYYSGTIFKKGVLNTYEIHFDDDTVSNTSEVQILPISVLGAGTKVLYLPDEFSGPTSAQVVGQKYPESDPESTDVQYAIKCYGSDNVIICNRRQLYLGGQQAKDLRKKYEAVQPKFGDVNLDNVVSGPRRRAPVSESTFEAVSSNNNSNTSPVSTKKTPSRKSKKSKSPATNANVRKPKKRKSATTASDDDSADEEPMPKLQPVSHEVAKTSTENVRVSSKSAIKKGANIKVKVQTEKATAAGESPDRAKELKFNPKPQPSQSQESLIGRLMINLNKKSNVSPPAPKSFKEDAVTKTSHQGSLFKGYFFFLTSGDKDLIKGTGGSQSREISKQEMQKLIHKHGGTELVQVGEDKGKPRGRIFLLASSHLRTLKYLYCVASGIPCVTQKWVEDCIAKNEVLDWTMYRLSAGWSIEEKKLVPIHSNYPLQNMKIGLATFRSETIDTWKKLIPAAKGTVLISKDFHYDKQPAELKVPEDWLVDGNIDILVSDYFCPEATMETLKKKNIRLVRIEWLVQTIILGRKADYKVGEITPPVVPVPVPADNSSQKSKSN